MVLLELGCGLADGRALGEGVTGCASSWSGMLSVTTCRSGISKSRSVTSKVRGLVLLFLVEGRLVLSVHAGCIIKITFTDTFTLPPSQMCLISSKLLARCVTLVFWSNKAFWQLFCEFSGGLIK